MKTVMFLSLLLSFYTANSQYTFKITTKEGVPIAGVHVVVKEQVFVSDAQGYVQLKATIDPQESFVVRHIGYKTIETYQHQLKQNNNLLVMQSLVEQLPELYISNNNAWQWFQKVVEAKPTYTSSDTLISYSLNFTGDTLVKANKYVFVKGESGWENYAKQTLLEVETLWNQVIFDFEASELALQPNTVLKGYARYDSSHYRIGYATEFVNNTQFGHLVVESSSKKPGVEAEILFYPDNKALSSYQLSLNEVALKKTMSMFVKLIMNASIRKIKRVRISDMGEYGLYSKDQQLQLHAFRTEFTGSYQKQETNLTTLTIQTGHIQSNLTEQLESYIAERAKESLFLKFFQINF